VILQELKKYDVMVTCGATSILTNFLRSDMATEEKTVLLPPLDEGDCSSTTEKPISITYRTFGDAKNKVLVLIMGLGGQLVAWNENLLKMFVDKGYFVVVYDNRDVGKSTKFDDEFGAEMIAESNKLVAANMESLAAGKMEDIKPIKVAYQLQDMAKDCIRLMNFLKIDKAHIAGASMGGMIAQLVYTNFPSRVLSLSSIMSSAGHPVNPEHRADAETMKQFGTFLQEKASAATREEIVAVGVKLNRLFGETFFDEEEVKAREEIFYDRAYFPSGIARQLLAIQTGASRAEALKKTSIEHPVPILVLHGAEDKLLPPAAGKCTAEHLQGSKLVIVDQMGHNFPKQLYERIVEEITSVAK
jgi:pimeloyl-ACP methyl ester carboxylesterase